MPVAAGQGGERASMEDHGSDFGPCSAMRPLDDADPRELAREGWDSDADWDYKGPEPCLLFRRKVDPFFSFLIRLGFRAF